MPPENPWDRRGANLVDAARAIIARDLAAKLLDGKRRDTRTRRLK